VCDGQVVVDLAHISSEAAENFEAKNKEAVGQLHKRAVDITGSEHTAGMAFIRAFARSASIARREGRHGSVSRLKNGAYHYLPPGVDRSIVRDIFGGTGACGHEQPSAKPDKPVSQVPLVKG
jgi:hypothetical protein